MPKHLVQLGMYTTADHPKIHHHQDDVHYTSSQETNGTKNKKRHVLLPAVKYFTGYREL